MPSKARLAELVEQVPDLDKVAKIRGPKWSQIEPSLDEILADGQAGVVGLIDMLKQVDNGDDWKVRYVMHALAVYVTRPGKEKQRLAASAALTGQLSGDRPVAIQGFLIRELQWLGRREAVEPIGRKLADTTLYNDAASALLAIGGDGVVEQFRAALPTAAGRQRTAMIQALGVLRDAGSVDAMRKATSDADSDTRQVARWALANVGDAGSVDLLLKGADASEGFERIKATKACLLLAEHLVAAGNKADATRIYKHLRDSRNNDSEAYIREAAQRGLAAVG